MGVTKNAFLFVSYPKKQPAARGDVSVLISQSGTEYQNIGWFESKPL
jgi:hypothetical protein